MSASSPSARVVLMTRGDGAGVAGLTELLGSERSAALSMELLARASRWAAELASGAVHVVPGCDEPSATLAGVVTELFQAGDSPVLVAWPELPSWRPEHAEGALGDLADACDVSLGPMFDGGFYLVAFARPLSSLLQLSADAWQSPDPVGMAAKVAIESGLGIGLLRTERGLRAPADVRALLADPLLDPELRRLLS